MTTKLKYLLLSSLLLITSNCFSNTDTFKFSDNFSYSGYVSQYYLYSKDVDWHGSRGGTFGFREAGINTSYSFNKNISLYAHIGSVETDIFTDYAFLNFSTGSMTQEYGINIGKIKRDFSLLNDTRRNSTARGSILLPTLMYFESTNDLYMDGIGAVAYAKKQFGDFTLRGELVYSKPFIFGFAKRKLFNETHLMDSEDYDDLEISNTPSVGFTLKYKDKIKFHLGTTLVPVEFTQPDNSTPDIAGNFITQDVTNIGIQYRNNKFSLGLEGFYGDKYVDFGKNISLKSLNRKSEYFSYYLQLGYDITPKLQLNTYYNYYKSKVSVEIPIPGVEDIIRHPNGSDIMVGATYKFNKNWSIRGEYHKFNTLVPVINEGNKNEIDRTDFRGNWDLFAVGINYKF